MGPSGGLCGERCLHVHTVSQSVDRQIATKTANSAHFLGERPIICLSQTKATVPGRQGMVMFGPIR